MADLWNEEAKFRAWLRIELAVCRARAFLGEIPAEEAEELAQKADFTTQRVKEIEKETNHDVIAFVTAVSETVAETGAADVARHFHFGLTSSDVLDTAGALQLKEALGLIREEAESLAILLCEMALAHRGTVMVGRTHGVHAEPTTLGHKLAVWAFEMERNLERLDRRRGGLGRQDLWRRWHLRQRGPEGRGPYLRGAGPETGAGLNPGGSTRPPRRGPLGSGDPGLHSGEGSPGDKGCPAHRG